MKRTRVVWIALTFLVIIVAGGYVYYASFGSSEDSNQGGEALFQETIARTGDLIVSVSGSGELVPVSEVKLSFPNSGELVELNVRVGDQVQAGEVLARLQIDQTPAELQAALTSAELEVIRAQNNLDQIFANAQIDAAKALMAVEEAQQALEEINDFELQQALAQQALSQAEEAIQDAEMKLYIVNSSPSQEAVNIAFASLLFKEKELKETQDQIAQIEYQFKSASDKMVRDRLEGQLLSLRARLAGQQNEYEKALYSYNTMDDPPEEIDLVIAEAQLATTQAQLAEAQMNWEESQAGPRDSDLNMAEAQLAEAQAEWERLKDGPDPNEIALAEAQLAKAQAKLALVQGGQLILDLISPIDGMVLAINATVGDRLNKETVLTLVDLGQPIVKVSLDEADLENIQVGYRAEVVFDAVPGLTFSGQVVAIYPSLHRVGNSQAVQAEVQLDEMPNELIRLPLGLNATVDIIAGEVTNAVLVPLEALKQQADGTYIVYVIPGEQVELRQVEVGLMDLTTAEVVNGLQPGESVAIGDLNFDQE